MAPKRNRTQPNKNKPKRKAAKQANETKKKEETLFQYVQEFFAGCEKNYIVEALKQIFKHKSHERYDQLLKPVQDFIRRCQSVLHKQASRQRASLKASNPDLKFSPLKHSHLQLLPDYDEQLFKNIAEAVSKLPKQDQANVPTVNNLATSAAGIMNGTTCPGNSDTPPDNIFFGFGPGEHDIVLRHIVEWDKHYKTGVVANSTDEIMFDNLCSLLHDLHLEACNSGAVSGNDVVDNTANHDINHSKIKDE